MKKTTVSLVIWVAFVVFLNGAAIAGVFGNDNLELTPDQELIVRAALGEQAVVRVKVAENIPLSQPQLPTTSAPVAQAPVNYQPQQPVVSLPPVQMAPPVVPPVQMVRQPVESPAVQPRQPETRVASAPPAKPAAPVAIPAPAKPVAPVVAALAKPAAPVNREQLAKAGPASKPDKEVRKLVAMRLPIEKFPKEIQINGKLYKKINNELFEVANSELQFVGKEVWAVAEEVNGSINPEDIKIMNAPPKGAEIQPFKG